MSASEHILNMIKFKVTPRIVTYTALLTVLITILTVLLLNRDPVDVIILRTPGMMFQEHPDGKISNLYSLKLTNKTFETVNIKMELDDIEGEIKVISGDIVSNQMISGYPCVDTKEKIKKMSTPLELKYLG
jgi:polyferredoxin